MTLDLLLTIIAFAFTTVITPGPNNLMLMSSGANFGLRQSLPHMLGIIIGFPIMVFMVGIGIMEVFDLWPLSHSILKVLSVVYLLFLAWKIAHAAPPTATKDTGQPLSFLQAAAFQWVNPKAWTMALSAITLFATGRDLASVLWVTGVYVLVSFISTTSWALMGQQISRFLTNPTQLKAFNMIMAFLLVATLIPVLWSNPI